LKSGVVDFAALAAVAGVSPLLAWLWPSLAQAEIKKVLHAMVTIAKFFISCSHPTETWRVIAQGCARETSF
jgi:hypothetical protein